MATMTTTSVSNTALWQSTTAADLSSSTSRLARAGPFPKTWVPLASAYELDGSRPNSVYFLNQEYVIYQSKGGGGNSSSNSDTEPGAWVVCDAACPHRLAPLSEGRIVPETGQLECAYHGWTFDASGTCTRIPQWSPPLSSSSSSSSSSAESSASIQLPSCRLPTYPCVVENNVIWAWLWTDTDPFAHDTAATITATDTDTSVIPHAQRLPEYFLLDVPPNSTTYTRDLPYSYDTLLENIVDPAHVPFAHHGMQGTRHDAIPITMSRPTDVTAAGFNFTFSDRTMKMRRSGMGIFRAPFVIQYAAEFEPPQEVEVELPTNGKPRRQSQRQSRRPAPSRRKMFNLTTILIPTRPGWSRIIIYGSSPTRTLPDDTNTTLGSDASTSTSTAIAKKKKRKSSLIGVIMKVLPVWLIHQFSNMFLDSDLVFLHCQEQERERRLHPDGANGSSGNSHNNNGAVLDRVSTSTLQRRGMYFLPAQADRCVVALRQWVHDYAHVLGPLPPRETNRRVLFDRWQQHSDQCKHCQDVANRLPKWRNRTYGVMAMSLLLLHRFVLARIAAVACLGLLRFYNWVDSTMRQGDFRHYKNH